MSSNIIVYVVLKQDNHFLNFNHDYSFIGSYYYRMTTYSMKVHWFSLYISSSSFNVKFFLVLKVFQISLGSMLLKILAKVMEINSYKFFDVQIGY